MDQLLRAFGDLPDAVRILGRGGVVLQQNEAARLMGDSALDHVCRAEARGAGRRDPSCPACQVDEVFDKGLFLRWHVTRGPIDDRDYFEVTLSPIRADDESVEAVLEVVRDASATLGVEQYLIGRAERQDVEIQKRSEELGNIQRTQTDMVARDRLTALSLLVQSLSHEIHTPLGAMLSCSDLLERTLGRLEGEIADALGGGAHDGVERRIGALRKHAGILTEGARRIQGVVRTLRMFTRLDEATTQRVDLHEGLDSTLELLQYRMGGKIEVERRYGELPRVTCRPDAINQVFMNLLVNATQAIVCEGRITIATARRGDEVVVRIADDGVGIPEDVQRRIFDVGFTTRGEQSGTGIGLALSRRIIEEHGGSLAVESEPGHGSTFTIRLPLGPLDIQDDGDGRRAQKQGDMS